MLEMYKTKVHGQILYGHLVLKCPRCSRSRGLTVNGYLGRPGRIKCPCGNDFPVPPPFDATRLLEQVVAARDGITELTFGPLPDPDSFR